MSRSVPLSAQRAFAAGVAALFALPVVQGGVVVAFEVLGIPADGPSTVYVAATLCVIGAAALVRQARDRDDSDGSVWDAIPSRQYAGRHAESGGLARGEQEAALEELQGQQDEE